MARIRAARPKNVSGSYERLFGDAEIRALASEIQSAVIAAGNELQRMLTDRVDVIDDLDAFLETEIMPECVLLAQKSSANLQGGVSGKRSRAPAGSSAYRRRYFSGDAERHGHAEAHRAALSCRAA